MVTESGELGLIEISLLPEKLYIKILLITTSKVHFGTPKQVFYAFHHCAFIKIQIPLNLSPEKKPISNQFWPLNALINFLAKESKLPKTEKKIPTTFKKSILSLS